jgi:hypothetical protein
LFANSGQVANLETCGAACFFGGETACEMRGGGLLNVVLDFIGEVVVGGGAIGQNAQAANELAPE